MPLARVRASPCARDLMEPLRAIAGARETIADAARRLRAHQASACPVVSSGRPVGLVTRAQTENALRHGLGDARVTELAIGGAPRVRPGADLRVMKRASIGIAPGLLVGGGRGALLGVVTRHRLEEALHRHLPPLAPPTWLLGRDLGSRMNALVGPALTEVLRRAGGLAGAEGVGLYLAGGVVRDLLLGRPSKDLDLVVEGDGVSFAEELGRVLDAGVTRHATFGTAVIMLKDGARVDVASARRETYDTPSMLPRVTPGSMLEDLLRRDLTINSMAIRLDGARYGRLTDELGGERDLRAGLLRVNHSLSLTEDPTRAFRIARLAGRFGFTPSAETLLSLDLARRAGAFAMLTGERLFREFCLIAAEDDPASALRSCAELGLLSHAGEGLIWDAAALRSVRRLLEGRRVRPDGKEDPRVAAERAIQMLILMTRRARPAQRAALAERLRIRGEAAERLRTRAGALQALERALSRARRPSRIARLLEQAPPDLVALCRAAGSAAARRALDLYVTKLRSVRVSVTGETLRALGLPPGPGYKEVLAALKEARLDGRVSDAAGERKLAQRLVRRLTGARPRED